MRTPSEVLLWITPKIFDDLCRPAAAVGAFFDHYRDWFDGRRATVAFAAGNCDHILNYAGRGSWLDRFDWARYNGYAPAPEPDRLRRGHNREWLARVRHGGERSGNPYAAGPMMILSEQAMDYEILAGIYSTIRAEADSRGLAVRLLEYLEPGPGRCASEWKSRRHPEAAAATAPVAGRAVPGLIDVAAPLAADRARYAAWPEGFGSGLLAGDFVAGQAAAFCADFGLDGIVLGDRFGHVGPRDSSEERRAGIARCFARMRERLGDRLIYSAHRHGPAEAVDAARASVDAFIVSNDSASPGRRTVERPSRGEGPRRLMELGFVDPWYWGRAHLDDLNTYRHQREVLADSPQLIDGITFFANDTFGHFVMDDPLAESLEALRRAEGRAP